MTINRIKKFIILKTRSFKPLIDKFNKNHPYLYKLIISLLILMPVIIFMLPIIFTGNKIIPGDGDYYIQMYEALRISIFDYRQFPWWNPWVSGGIPLFANPQFGLISIQSPLVLLFGSVIGYKIALALYVIIGFIGFRLLFIRVFKSDNARATLLAYIWTFSSFIVYRSSGHYTFLMVAFIPWVLYLYRFKHYKNNWILLSLLLSFMVWSAVHYVTIITLILLAIISIVNLINILIKSKKSLNYKHFRKEIVILFKIFTLTLTLSALRLYYVIEYLKDFPRIQNNYADPFIGIWNGLYALFGIDQFNNFPSYSGPWGWSELSTSISLFTAMVLIYLIFIYLRLNKINRQKFTEIIKFPYYLIIILILFVIGLADFGTYSPYNIIKDLPIFSSMRVAPRYIAWSSIVVLCLIAAVKLNRKQNIFVNIFLFLGSIQLFITGYPYMGNGYSIVNKIYREPGSIIEQRKFWNNNRAGPGWHDENFTESTMNNIGQIYAGDSIIDTRGPVATSQCPIDDGCSYISDNAEIKYWSPNKIVIKRLKPGPIQIQMNPGSRWQINEEYRYKFIRVVEPSRHFIINNPSEIITIEYIPRFSLPWLENQLLTRFKN